MDYLDEKQIKFYENFEHFYKQNKNQRIILMTTKASMPYTKFKFEKKNSNILSIINLLSSFNCSI